MGLFQRSILRVVDNTNSDRYSSESSKEKNKKATKVAETKSIQSDDHVDETSDYGIEEVMNLFHSLPHQSNKVEASAVVRTMSSFNIDINEIIDDAEAKESLTQKRLKILKLEIELFKAKIQKREKELALLELGLNEMTKTKKFLKQGIQLNSNVQKGATPKKKVRNLKRKKTTSNSTNARSLADKIKSATTEAMLSSKEPNIVTLKKALKKTKSSA
ncbi:hypothetical protein [Kaarinaea lacus]